jgi:2'-5' RNA ligase
VTERPSTRRLFIALPLPDLARDTVAELVTRARATEAEGARVRWVRLDGLHLTLRFLGPTPADRLGSLEDLVAEVAAISPPIEAVLGGAGAFPNPSRPRVLWLDVVGGADGLAALATAVDDGLERRGWPRSDRPYRAHLTLARTDGAPGGRAAAAAIEAAASGFRISFVAAELALMESLTGRGPARYGRLASAALAGERPDP